jgi:hypothetical protein
VTKNLGGNEYFKYALKSKEDIQFNNASYQCKTMAKYEERNKEARYFSIGWFYDVTTDRCDLEIFSENAAGFENRSVCEANCLKRTSIIRKKCNFYRLFHISN